jgi:hypothetical protein
MPFQMRQRSNSVRITSSAFVPLVVTCSLPPSLNPADARFVFEYNASDPGTITQMTLAASSWYATNAWQQNTLSGRFRLWTKDASHSWWPDINVTLSNFVPSISWTPQDMAWTFQERLKVGLLLKVLPGVDSEGGWGFNFDYSGMTVPNNVRSNLFSEAITAVSRATGANDVSVFLNNRVMNTDLRRLSGNGVVWPPERTASPYLTRWLHCDFREVAYPFV